MFQCAVCIMVKMGEPFPAVTVKSGTAVCIHHYKLVRDDNVSAIYKTLPVLGGAVKYQEDKDFEDADA